MLKKVLGLVMLAGTAHAGAYHAAIANPCTIAANMAATDASPYTGVDPDGTSISFDENGVTQISRPENIVSRLNKNGVETITYKTKQLRVDAKSMNEYETVQRTITITRENGKIVSVNKDRDISSDIKLRKELAQAGYPHQIPIAKAVETTFAHKGADCEINQTLVHEMANETAKPEAKVLYDRQFCEKLSPLVKRMGSQNASQCVGLIGQAQLLFDQRNKELKNEGKAFKVIDFPGKKADNAMANLDVGQLITACATGDAMVGGPWGFIPGGGMMGGFGMGIMGGVGQPMGMGMMVGTPEKSNSKSKVKESSSGTGAR